MKLSAIEGLVYIRSESGRLFAIYDPGRSTMEIVRNGETLKIPLDELRKIGENDIDVITESSVYSGHK